VTYLATHHKSFAHKRCIKSQQSSFLHIPFRPLKPCLHWRKLAW